MDLQLTFNEDAQNYDNARPSYPSEIYNDIFDYSKINDKSKCLEIGIGTGQATIPFLKKGCSVTAIELGINLSNFVANKYKQYDNFSVINDDFMDCKLPENHYDLVYSATAFHWLPDEAYKKIFNLLKPNGTIALFWNHPFPNRLDDRSNIINRRIYDKYRPDNRKQKEFSQINCVKIIKKLEKNKYKNIKTKLYHRIRTFSTEEYINLINTYSDHRSLPSEIKYCFERDMRKELNNAGGSINIYDTIDLYLAGKT